MPPARTTVSPITLARRLVAVAGVLALTALLVAAAPAEPSSAHLETAWSQFQGGPQHDGVASGPAVPLRQSWRETGVARGTEGLSSPVTDGETVYALSRDAVNAFAVSNGALLWSVPRDGGALGPPALAESSGGHLLVYTEGEDAETRLVAIDPENPPESKPNRSDVPGDKATPSPSASPSPSVTPSPAELSPSASPPASPSPTSEEREAKLPEGVVMRVDLGASSRSGVTVIETTALVGDDAGTVHAIDLSNGSELWKAAAATDPIAIAPVALDGVAYLETSSDRGDASLKALNMADGKEKWRTDIGPLGPIATGLTIGDGRIFAGFADRSIRGFRIDTGAEVWSRNIVRPFQPSAVSPFSSPAFADGKVFVPGVSGGLFALDGATGETVWDFQFGVDPTPAIFLRSSPVVVGDSVIIGMQDGRIAAVDIARGRQIWQAATGEGPLKAIAVTPDTVIVGKGGTGGGLVGFVADPGQALTDIESQTTLDIGANLIAFFGALVIVAAVVLVLTRGLGQLAARRAAKWADPDELDDTDEPDPDEPDPDEPDPDESDEPKGWR